MTDWNPDHPFYLGNLGVPCPSYGEKLEGYLPPQLAIPPFVSQDPTKSPEAKKD